MDPRTGLGRFRQFRISKYQLMMQLIDACTELAVEEIKRCSQVFGDMVVLDLRDEEVIHPTNRFTLYALFPQCNLSVHVLWGLKQQNTVFAMGKSILDRSSTIDVGELMLSYGGGGHEAAGTCQVDNERAVHVLAALIARVND